MIVYGFRDPSFCSIHLFFFGYFFAWFGLAMGIFAWFASLGLSMCLIVYPNIPKERDRAQLFWEAVSDLLLSRKKNHAIPSKPTRALEPVDDLKKKD